MRLKMMMAVAAVSASALVGGSMAAFATGPDGEHGHGFNCTPGNPGNAEFQHDSRGNEDHGNGEDCLQAATITPPTTVAPMPQPSGSVSATTARQQAAVSAGATARAPAKAVVAQPRTTG